MAITEVNIFRPRWEKYRKGKLDLFVENQNDVKLKREKT
jgi:hypothetical protein